MKETKLIRNLMRRKFVLCDERDRKDRSKWCRVVARELTGNRLIILAKTKWGDFVRLTWSRSWDNPIFKPSDCWYNNNKKLAMESFKEHVRIYRYLGQSLDSWYPKEVNE